MEYMISNRYWIYGADNNQYFIPGLAPSYEYRIDVVTPPTNTWISPNGIDDPYHNSTYIIIAVDRSENELARSNRAGGWDYGIER